MLRGQSGMHNNNLHLWQHSHTFDQELKRPGEMRTLIVIGITGTMMGVEIISGIFFGSMALLADGLHMASHTVALSINAFAYIYARRNASATRVTFLRPPRKSLTIILKRNTCKQVCPQESKVSARSVFKTQKARKAAGKTYQLNLYVIDQTPKSVAALANLKRVRKEHLMDDCRISVIDIEARPEIARENQIVIIPTLVKSFPLPAQRMVGDLSNTERVLARLSLPPKN